ncbi:hypothetical protein FRC11_005715 [Ceratobasidium sp. 423]|nr:hypothetical protein FRC11_005715 [Ceratobasidium sp. 423]
MSPVPTSPQHSQYPLTRNPVSTPSRRHGEAATSTPFRVSSALSTSVLTAESNPSYVDASRQSASATSAPVTQVQMDKFIESELHNAIFHDPKFIDRFLSGDVDKLDQVHEECQRLDSNYRKKGQWKLPSAIKTEKSLYAPMLHILNKIKEAVDIVNPPTRNISRRDREPTGSDGSDPLTSDDDPSDDFVPEQPRFINTSTYAIPSDQAETRLIKPDLVLFEDVEEKQRHWEHVRMPVEIKKLTGYHKAGMKQLSRYARAVFAHQLHRRHLYAMMVCNTEATFVRFDRAGILYSHRIDLRKNSKAFTYAFASLLMLDETDQGYDPAFTCQMNEHGRLDYYIDLPASAFVTQTPTTDSTTNGEVQTDRFLVVDILCHRKSISGRATIVLRIRKVRKDGEEGEGDEYVLKIMWRDPERGLEGEVLKKVKGKFGLAQHVWHGDAFGKCRCSPKIDGKWQCKKCVADTAQIGELEVCDKLTDIAIEVPPEEAGKDPKLRVPLERAESPRQFMEAVLDAILGYWGLFNIGILHRDISEGNVLMLTPGQQLDRQTHDTDGTELTDQVLIESEKKLREVLDQLGGREPTGMLSDFDLHAMHTLTSRTAAVAAPSSVPATSTEADRAVASCAPSPCASVSPSPRTSGFIRPRQEDIIEDTREPKRRRTHSLHDGGKNRLIDFRTGTPAFMSIRVTGVPSGERYHHTFLDDIESFFWLIFWSATAHLDDGVLYPTPTAQDTLDLLNQQNPGGMEGYKLSQLSLCCIRSGRAMLDKLKKFNNSWASHPLFSNVIINLGQLAYEYYSEAPEKNFLPLDVFPAVVGVFQSALSSYPE